MSNNRRHGGPYDRGGADSYYGRPREPHFYLGKTYLSTRITIEGMTQAEIDLYNQGYDEVNTTKDWGDERTLDGFRMYGTDLDKDVG